MRSWASQPNVVHLNNELVNPIKNDFFFFPRNTEAADLCSSKQTSRRTKLLLVEAKAHCAQERKVVPFPGWQKKKGGKQSSVVRYWWAELYSATPCLPHSGGSLGERCSFHKWRRERKVRRGKFWKTITSAMLNAIKKFLWKAIFATMLFYTQGIPTPSWAFFRAPLKAAQYIRQIKKKKKIACFV